MRRYQLLLYKQIVISSPTCSF